jgi:hypothetical protein
MLMTFSIQGVGLSLGEEIDVSNSGKWAENLGEEADLPVELSEHIWGKVFYILACFNF